MVQRVPQARSWFLSLGSQVRTFRGETRVSGVVELNLIIPNLTAVRRQLSIVQWGPSDLYSFPTKLGNFILLKKSITTF